MSYRYLLNPFGPKLFVSLTVPLFTLCFPDVSIEESGLLKSPTITVWGVICALSFSKVSFMNEGALVFGTYSELRVLPSRFFPLMSIKCLSVSFFDDFCLKV